MVLPENHFHQAGDTGIKACSKGQNCTRKRACDRFGDEIRPSDNKTILPFKTGDSIPKSATYVSTTERDGVVIHYYEVQENEI